MPLKHSSSKLINCKVKREKWFSRHAIVFTRFLEITDRKEGDKCYSNSRSLEFFEKDLKTYQESEILKCRWINKCDSANFMVKICNWTTELGKLATSTLKDDEHYTHSAYLQGGYKKKTALYLSLCSILVFGSLVTLDPILHFLWHSSLFFGFFVFLIPHLALSSRAVRSHALRAPCS